MRLLTTEQVDRLYDTNIWAEGMSPDEDKIPFSQEFYEAEYGSGFAGVSEQGYIVFKTENDYNNWMSQFTKKQEVVF